MVIPSKSLWRGLISSWILLKFLFLWNPINIPRIAYQSIQEGKPYPFRFRLTGFGLEVHLLHRKNWGSKPLLKKKCQVTVTKSQIYQATPQNLKTQKKVNPVKLLKIRSKNRKNLNSIPRTLSMKNFMGKRTE